MKVHPLVWGAVLLALAWIALRRFERLMVFVPSRTMVSHPGVVGLEWEPLWLATSDGVRLRAWWLPGPGPDAPVMLCLHGNGGNLSSRVDKMRLFRDAGAAQLWVDWRGYGESAGAPDEPGLYRDALASWAWLSAEKSVPAARLVLYGESLGNGPAIELATRVPAAGLIVDSGFASIPAMAKVVLPFFPARLARIRFDNEAKLARVAIPTMFLHSPNDDVIPYAQAKANYAASTSAKKSFVNLRGGHNDGFLEDPKAYTAAIKGFLASLPAPSESR